MVFIKLLILFANVLYFLCKVRKIRSNRVLLLSRQSNSISIDFSLLKDEFEKNDFDVVVKCKMIGSGLLGKIKYIFYLFDIIFILPTCKICVIDGYCIPVSILKHKKELVVVQLWHALGAIKKFGYQALEYNNEDKKKLALTMKMHCNYNYIMCASLETKEIYTKAFNVSPDVIHVLGMPRVDYLNDLSNNLNKDIYLDYPHLSKKKTIVYVPTFRKKTVNQYNELIELVDTNVYNLIVSLHPLDVNSVNEDYTVSNKYNSYDLLEVADIIISDYSAIVIEASILNKRLYLFDFDYDEYKNSSGINIDLSSELNSCVCYNVDELVKKINDDDYNFDELKMFKEKFVETTNCNNTKSIVDFVKENC